MKVLKQVVINGVTGGMLGAGVLAIFAFLVAGSEGVLNGLVFGAVFGLVGGMAITGFAGGTYWWTGVAARFGVRNRHRERGGE